MSRSHLRAYQTNCLDGSREENKRMLSNQTHAAVYQMYVAVEKGAGCDRGHPHEQSISSSHPASTAPNTIYVPGSLLVFSDDSSSPSSMKASKTRRQLETHKIRGERATLVVVAEVIKQPRSHGIRTLLRLPPKNSTTGGGRCIFVPQSSPDTRAEKKAPPLQGFPCTYRKTQPPLSCPPPSPTPHLHLGLPRACCPRQGHRRPARH